MLNTTLKIFFLFATIGSTVGIAADKFELPKSTLDAIERRLVSEKQPTFRIELILRWIKAKEEYEQVQLSKKGDIDKNADDEFGLKPGRDLTPRMKLYTGFKEEIISKLQSEIESLETVPNLKMTLLYRELAFRHLELNHFQEAILMFDRIKPLTSGDWMGLGDAYFSMNQTVRALEAYEKGGTDSRFAGISFYKRAWCYLRLSQHKQSLDFFGRALDGTDSGSLRLREEAFKDRIRPYIEGFTKLEFDQNEFNSFLGLSKKVYPNDPAKSKELLLFGLRLLVDGFNAKALIEKARQVFEFYKKEFGNATVLLVSAAPIWIKVYRGVLNHEAVQKILLELPDEPIQKIDTLQLQGEIYNTVVFYDTLYKEEQRDIKNIGQNPIRLYLLNVNRKFFQLFPDDPNADSLRIGYAKLLLEDGNATDCLKLLARRKGSEKEIEDLALSFEAKCELKQLDQLYPKGPTAFFVERLNYNLLEKKTYERTDLGLSSDQAFETLSRMLIGVLKENPENQDLRSSLERLVKDFPLSKKGKLFFDLQLLQSEIRFVDLSKSKLSNEDKSTKFFEIFQGAPSGSDLAKKAIVNSIQLSLDKGAVDRCKSFQRIYLDEFKPGREIFDRCVRLADRYFDLESEYEFWSVGLDSLDEKQGLKVALLELGLGKSQGKKRLAALKSESAKKALQFWMKLDAPDEKIENQDLIKREREAIDFIDELQPISFSKVAKIVPQKIALFEKLDSWLLSFYKLKPASELMAKDLELRAEIALAMRDWMAVLPAPDGLSPQDLEVYKSKAAGIVKPWEDAAAARIKECGEVAHALSWNFKVRNLNACPILVPSSVKDKILDAWEASKQKTPNTSPWKEAELNEKTQTAQRLLEQAARETDSARVRYHLLRALDFADTNYEKARAYLGFAKQTNKAEFWEQAAALDGNLVEPIQWKRSQAEGNPFFVQLFDHQLAKLK